MNPLPILYSFRRCPYAIRARLAIKVSQLQVELREVVLADKPKEMLRLSPKATVPVLVLADGTVIDESRDIMLWALEQYDPQHWLGADSAQEKEISHLIDLNDTEFKSQLDRYKYADRYPQQSMVSYRQQAEVFLQHLEDKLNQHPYLIGEAATLADMALLPFIRQFAYVDADWFAKTHYTKLQIWLANFLAEKLFSDVMKKFPQWRSSDSVQTIF